jgi:hypothetical protein
MLTSCQTIKLQLNEPILAEKLISWCCEFNVTQLYEQLLIVESHKKDALESA